MIVTSFDVPVGYKRTDFRVIPDDWSLVPLGRLITSVEYGSSAKSNPKGHTPVLRMGNLQSGRIDWKDLVYTDDESEIRKYRLQSGDVLFNRTNTIDLVGKCAIYNGERSAIFAGYLIRINVDKSILDSRFLNYVLNAEFSKRHSTKVLSVAVGQANINAQKVKPSPIPLPPTLSEQEAIAEALGDADAFIESLEQLVAKKRHLKQAAMEQLLTGKKRLPGFEGEWEKRSLGDICLKVQDGTHFSPRLGGSDFLYITSKNIGIGTLDLSDAGRISKSEHDKIYARCDVKRGDLLLTKDGANTGNAAMNTLTEPFSLLSSVAMLRFDMRRDDARHFMYQILSSDGQRQIKRQMSGNAITRLTLEKIRGLQFPAPSFSEQTAIANILSDMDAAVTAIEAKLAKARQIKQGMMQELLTGRTRLVGTTSAIPRGQT